MAISPPAARPYPRGPWYPIVSVGGIALLVHPGAAVLFGIFAAPFAVGAAIRFGAPLGAALYFGVLAALASTAVLLLHELGHTFVACRLDRRPVAVLMFWLGAATAYEQVDRNPRTAGLIAAAGPIANGIAALAALSVILWSPDPVSHVVGVGFALFNGLFAATNLAPIYPQDGWRLLVALLAGLGFGPDHAPLVAVRLGLILTLLVAFAGLAAQSVLLIVVGFGLVGQGLVFGRQQLFPRHGRD